MHTSPPAQSGGGPAPVHNSHHAITTSQHMQPHQQPQRHLPHHPVMHHMTSDSMASHPSMTSHGVNQAGHRNSPLHLPPLSGSPMSGAGGMLSAMERQQHQMHPYAPYMGALPTGAPGQMGNHHSAMTSRMNLPHSLPPTPPNSGNPGLPMCSESGTGSYSDSLQGSVFHHQGKMANV